MKMLQPLFAPVTLSLLVALLGAVVWGQSTPANAATTTTTKQVAVSGTVSGDSGTSTLSASSTDSTSSGGTESVSFSGQVVISAAVTDDPDFGSVPVVVLSIDLSKVSGVGSTSGKKYVTTNRAVIQRRLSGSDAVRFTFPFWQSGANAITASRVGGASFSLSFDVGKKTLTGASGSVTSP